MPHNSTIVTELIIESEKACPIQPNNQEHGNSSRSIIGGFLTSFCILTSIYFILGTAYNMSVNKSKLNHYNI